MNFEKIYTKIKQNKTFFWSIMIINILLNITVYFGFFDQGILQKGKEIKASFEVGNREEKKEVNSLYIDPGAQARINGENKEVSINTGYIKNNQLTDSYVLYTVKINEYRVEEHYKKITMVDTTAPRISFIGTEVTYIPLDSAFKEPGYEAIDNYDGDITKKVQKSGKVNTKEEGEYTLTYKVEDSSGNKTIRTRTFIVKKDIPLKEEDEDLFKKDSYSQTITRMRFTNKGVVVEGYTKKASKSWEIELTSKNKKTFEMEKIDENNYKGEIPLKRLSNGTYTWYINYGNKREKMEDKRDKQERLVRARVGDKLITFQYENDTVIMKVEKFRYEYDIVIDPGHGGFDTGGLVNEISEKQMNLEQSLYEKKRFEDHGYKVKLIRDDDTYGEMLGEEEWLPITKRAYTVGYYGAISKITYSNHHNSTSDPSIMGWEILVSASSTSDDLKLQHQIIEKWNQIYPLTENHIRLYARNYDTGIIYNKINGQEYAFKDYYAVNRIPLSLFGVHAAIYEGSYMSNPEDFNWYYKEENYKKLSEAKMKVYVESLGGTYKPLE